MGNTNSQQNSEFITTQDGSPTATGLEGEPMHSLAGALSESLYIYGSVLEQGFQSIEAPNILSVGLGLGYNEILSVAIAIKFQIKDFKIQSQESRLDLIEDFTNEIHRVPQEDKSSSPYRLILTSVANHFNMDTEFLRLKITSAIKNNKLQLLGPLSETSPLPLKKFEVILFDAYSSKTSPNLWTSDFFDTFLQNWCADQCLFTTYAKTGLLKRSLLKHGFLLQKRKGFAGKRDCTLAKKGFSPLP